MSLSATLRDAATQLAPVSDTPRLDAEMLMAFALDLSRSAMLLRQTELAEPMSFAPLLALRLAHQPVAYIIGTQDFWDLSLKVTPDVLIPRSDSETIIEAAVDAFAGQCGPSRILDLGTGSGALLLASLSVFPDAYGTAIDASQAALDIARANAQTLGFAPRSTWLHLSWCDAGWVDSLDTSYDMILCNPPYIEADATLSPMVADYEPHSALFAGDDGLDDYRTILPELPALLAPNGVAIFEIGHEQAQSVSELATLEGLKCSLRRDLAGKPRALVMYRDE